MYGRANIYGLLRLLLCNCEQQTFIEKRTFLDIIEQGTTKANYKCHARQLYNCSKEMLKVL